MSWLLLILWLSGSKRRVGIVVGMLTSVGWFCYGWQSRQFGFLRVGCYVLLLVLFVAFTGCLGGFWRSLCLWICGVLCWLVVVCFNFG